MVDDIDIYRAAKLLIEKHCDEAAIYYGRPVTIEFENEENSLNVGKVLLTRSGRDLVTICGSRPNEDHYEHVISEWAKKGYALSCPVGTKSLHPSV